MKRILAAVLLLYFISTPVFASPFYAGLQIDDTSAGVLFGAQINKTFAVETHYSKANSSITHAGVTVDTSSTGIGFVGLAKFPMKLNDVQSYSLFVKGGFEHTSNTETYSIPSSATLTLPYSGKLESGKNQATFGGGADYDFAKSLTGRVGVDILGGKRSINLSAIFRF
jgi:hypothetical protein